VLWHHAILSVVISVSEDYIASISGTLKMEKASSYETPVNINKTMLYHNPEDHNINYNKHLIPWMAGNLFG
jgi:hypothetical protein